MTCYVDQLRRYPDHRSGQPLWCHLVTDGELDELHAFAARLGVLRERFQGHTKYPHYDLPPAYRERALSLGAVPVDSRELVRLLRSRHGRPDNGN